jgi:hypothetical protein
MCIVYSCTNTFNNPNELATRLLVTVDTNKGNKTLYTNIMYLIYPNKLNNLLLLGLFSSLEIQGIDCC